MHACTLAKLIQPKTYRVKSLELTLTKGCFFVFICLHYLIAELLFPEENVQITKQYISMNCNMDTVRRRNIGVDSQDFKIQKHVRRK